MRLNPFSFDVLAHYDYNKMRLRHSGSIRSS